LARHREFDPEKALETAMLLFWEKGYEGTSYADLCAATGVARPSLYATFGDKQALFFKALERYMQQEMRFLQEALQEPTALQVVETMLKQSALANTQQDKPQGCLGINGALACSDKALPIQETLNHNRAAAFQALQERLERAQREGDMPQATDAATVTRMVMTLTQGVAVQAKAGASRQQIHEMLDLAVAMLRPHVSA